MCIFPSLFTVLSSQTAALFGAHTIGVTSRQNSGFNVPLGWVRNEQRFNNGMFF